MNKQAETEQAYWNGFSVKCAEMGVDAEKLAQAIPEFRAVGTEAAANANRRAAKANEPDWLDTPQDMNPEARPGSYGEMTNDLFEKNERLRLNRALSAGNVNAPVEHDRHSSAFKGTTRPWGTPSRFVTARDAGLAVPYNSREKSLNPVEDTLNRDALVDYDRMRQRNTPRAAERILRDRGYGIPQIEYIRDLIRRGVIQAGTRRPATGMGVDAEKLVVA